MWVSTWEESVSEVEAWFQWKKGPVYKGGVGLGDDNSQVKNEK